VNPEIEYKPTDIDGLVTPVFNGDGPKWNMPDVAYTRVGSVVTITFVHPEVKSLCSIGLPEEK